MTLPVIAIRPEPGCASTLAAGAQLGLAMSGFPLFEIRPVAWGPLPADAFDALLIGSANALRHGGARLRELCTKPVYAVGEVTAATAREQGFEVAKTGAGGMQALIDSITPPVRLLRLAGEDHVRLTGRSGVTIDTRVVYASQAQAMPAALAEALRPGAVVLLHSGAAARHFAAECLRLGVATESIDVLALAPRIAELAGHGWRSVHTAAEPSDGALLALAADLCHDFGRGEGR